MREVGTYSFTYHSPSASATGWADPSRDSPAYPHYSQVSGESGPNQGSDGGSTLHNEIFRPPSEEGASPTGLGENPGRPSYQCTLCPKREFAQKQGLMRHHREKHLPGFVCLHPDCDYEWTRSRRSEYRKHLKKNHILEDDKIAKILAMVPRLCHRRGRVIEGDLPPQFSPPPIESDRQSLAEPQQRPLMLPLPAVGKDTNHASPPLIPSVAYNPQFGHAEPEVTSTEHEDSIGLEHYPPTHAPSRSFSKEDIAVLGRYYEVHRGFPFPSVHLGGSTTADIPPNPGMPHIPALPSPVAGYHTSPISGDRPALPWMGAASTSTDASSWL